LTVTSGGSGILTINGSGTFTGLAISGTRTKSIKFDAPKTTTITTPTFFSGVSGGVITIASTTASTAATISCASGTVSSDYLSLQDSTATGGASFYAGANSTDVSGNTGWVFTAPPASNFFLMFN